MATPSLTKAFLPDFKALAKLRHPQIPGGDAKVSISRPKMEMEQDIAHLGVACSR